MNKMLERHLHHVEPLREGTLPGVLQGDDADLVALVVDQADRADPDLLVDADSLLGDSSRPPLG